MLSLNDFRRFRNLLIAGRRAWLNYSAGTQLHHDTSVSLSAMFVGGYKEAITVDEGTLIAFKTLILARDSNGTPRPIKVGKNCFVGGGSVLLPGTTIGDGSIIAAGAVVSGAIPPRSIVAGNPGRILRSGIATGRFGRLDGADENQKRYYIR